MDGVTSYAAAGSQSLLPFAPAGASGGAHELAIQTFFSRCFTQSRVQKTPIESFFAPPLMLLLAALSVLVASVDATRGLPSSPAARRGAKVALFGVAAAASGAQVVSHALALALNYGAYNENVSAAAMFVACALHAFHVVDVALVDTYLFALQAARRAAAVLAAALYLALLRRTYFCAAATAPALRSGRAGADGRDAHVAALRARERAWRGRRRTVRLFLLYAAMLALPALPALLLLLPRHPAAHGCQFSSTADRYVCSVRAWRKKLDFTMLGEDRRCDAASSDALAAATAPPQCGWRPSRRLLRTFGDHLLQAVLTARVVLPRLAVALAAAVAAATLTAAALRSAAPLEPRAPLPRALGAAVVALAGLHVAALLLLDVGVEQMFRLARRVVVCGCAYDGSSIVPPSEAVLAGAIAALDGLKLVVMLGKQGMEQADGAGVVLDEQQPLVTENGE